MTRNLTAGMQAEIVKRTIRPVLLYEGTLADGSTVRYWTGYVSLSWNSQTWIGAGTVIGLAPVEETDDVQAQSTTLTINGVTPAMISMVLQSLANGNLGIIRLAMLDDTNAVISTPRVVFRGLLNAAPLKRAVAEPVINLGYEHELVDLERPREWRWTDAHQKKLYTGDRGLEHIAALQDAEIPFGNKFKHPGL